MKSLRQRIEESENFKSVFEAMTGRQPTLDDVKAEVAEIDGIENPDSYAEELFSYMYSD